MRESSKALQALLYVAIGIGALSLLTAGLTSILFEEIEHPGDVTNAYNYAWSAVALATVSVTLFSIYLIRRIVQRKQAQGEDSMS